MALMSFFSRLFAKNHRTREPRFEDYRIKTGHTCVDHVPYACIDEFPPSLPRARPRTRRSGISGPYLSSESGG